MRQRMVMLLVVLGVAGTGLKPCATAAQRTGNFAGTKNQNGADVFIRDPLSGLPCSATDSRGCFAGNIVPADRIYKPGQALLNILPLPNTSASNYNYTTQFPGSQMPLLLQTGQPVGAPRRSRPLSLCAPRENAADRRPGSAPRARRRRRRRGTTGGCPDRCRTCPCGR